MVGRLPIVDGYTMDSRLKEFRRVLWIGGSPSIEFVPFDSVKGAELLEKIN